MTNEWPTVQLGELTERLTTRNSTGDTNVLTISARHGLVSQRDYFNKQVASKDLAHYFLLERGHFAYNKSYSDGYPVGAIKRLDKYPTGVVSPLYICFRPVDEKQLSSDFLVHYFEAGLLEGALRGIAKEGARNHGLLNVKPSEFFALPIRLPPIGVQQRVAAILSSVDDAIETTQAIVDQLQIVKQAAMVQLLTRGMPESLKRFKQTELGEVPESWEITTVGDLATFSGGNGFRPPDWSTKGLPIIRIQNLNGSRDFNYYEPTPDPAWVVEAGELLFAWAGSRGASFGPCLWPGPRGVLNQHIYRIVPGKRVRNSFLYFVLRLLTESVEKKAHGFKDSLVHLRKAELTGWKVALPPLVEQNAIVGVLASLDERLNSEREYGDALRGAKTTLMSVLLTGEVRVKPDEEAA